MNPRDLEGTRKVARLLDQGYTRARIAKVLHWSLGLVDNHIAYLTQGQALVPLGRSGQYRRGINARAWLQLPEPPPGGAPQLPEPHPPQDRLLTGAQAVLEVIDWPSWRLAVDAAKPLDAPFGVALTWVPAMKRFAPFRVRTSVGDAAVQIYWGRSRRVLLTLPTVALHRDALLGANEVLDQAANEVRVWLTKHLRINLGLVEWRPQASARYAEVPLRAGEIVKPLPGLDVHGVHRLSPTTQVDTSRPIGPALETTDLKVAAVDAELDRQSIAPRLVALEHVQQQILDLEEKHLESHRELQAIHREHLDVHRQEAESWKALNETLGGIQAAAKKPAPPGPEVR